MVEERFAKMEEYGEDWDDRPVCRATFMVSGISLNGSQNDMLMSLMSKTKEVGMSLEGLARRLLLVNFSGIHATSMASDDIPSPPMMQSWTLPVNRR